MKLFSQLKSSTIKILIHINLVECKLSDVEIKTVPHQNYRRSRRRLFHGLSNGGCVAFLQGHVLFSQE